MAAEFCSSVKLHWNQDTNRCPKMFLCSVLKLGLWRSYYKLFKQGGETCTDRQDKEGGGSEILRPGPNFLSHFVASVHIYDVQIGMAHRENTGHKSCLSACYSLLKFTRVSYACTPLIVFASENKCTLVSWICIKIMSVSSHACISFKAVCLNLLSHKSAFLKADVSMTDLHLL